MGQNIDRAALIEAWKQYCLKQAGAARFTQEDGHTAIRLPLFGGGTYEFPVDESTPEAFEASVRTAKYRFTSQYGLMGREEEYEDRVFRVNPFFQRLCSVRRAADQREFEMKTAARLAERRRRLKD